MGDTYYEQIVACNPPKTAGIEKAGLILLCVLSFFFIFIPYIGIFLTAGVIVFVVFRFQNQDFEYEYSFVNGELDVDKIIAKSRRKSMGTFVFKQIELMAPVGANEALRLENSKYKTFKFVSNAPDARVYVAYVMKDKEMVRVYFEPNDEIVGAISYLNPRKVIEM